MNTDSHIGRAVHSGERWVEMLSVGQVREEGVTVPNPSHPTPTLSWHKMQALPCRIYGFKGSARPFIIALLFLSLAGLSDRAEAPGADVTSSAASGPRDFNTFVFSAISVK